ncbi:MAG: polyphosphate kinase 1 [Candidatus Dormibacteria bacterium]
MDQVERVTLGRSDEADVKGPAGPPPASSTPNSNDEGIPPWPVGGVAGSLLNREVSWLDFNARVLAQAEDRTVPLLERARFLAIASRALDEFFQVRVGGLKKQIDAKVAVAANSSGSAEHLLELRQRVELLYQRQSAAYHNGLVRPLEAAGIAITDWDALDERDHSHLHRVFEERIFPVLTPLAVDPTHPFPYISSLSLNLVVIIADPSEPDQRIARVKVPPLLARFVALPDNRRFTPVEQVIAAHLDRLFPGMTVVSHHVFRLTRNADYELDEDEDDNLIDAVRAVLMQRRRSPLVARLEVDAGTPESLQYLLCRELGIDSQDVFTVSAPLDLGGLFELAKLDRPELRYPAWVAVTPGVLEQHDPDSPVDFFAALREQQVLVHHPYDLFDTTVERFIEMAAEDAHVLAIKQTLYRTSGPVSSIIRSLTRAAEAGKQVVALVELTARFDEQANINWAQVLEEAGVHVVYGTVGLKTHAKVALVVREEHGTIRRYCHVGTGNYNRDTSRAYEDIGLLSADELLGADISELFNSLTGYSRQRRYRRLHVAPIAMRKGLLELIRREGDRGSAGRIVIKVNNLVDEEVITALYTASQSGADIDLIVRSICCLRPGVPGLSENIRVRSVIARYLEHSRILRFGADPRDADYLISSADLMPRNLDRRVEVALPIRSAELRARLDEIIQINLRDNILAWQLRSDGTWERTPESDGADSQVLLQELAQRRRQADGAA